MTADKHQPVRIFAGASDNNFLFSAAEEVEEEERWNKSSCARSHNTEKRKGFFFFRSDNLQWVEKFKAKGPDWKAHVDERAACRSVSGGEFAAATSSRNTIFTQI